MTKRPIAAIAAIALVVSISGSVQAGVTKPDKRKARLAARYVVNQQDPDGSFVTFSTVGSTADGIIALVAARRGARAIGDALDFLVASEADVDSPGEIAKVTMALVAGGRDPRDFAGRDLVQEIVDSALPSGRYGMDNVTSQVFDQALSILALAGAGETPPVEAAQWLIDGQCGDGGWQFDAPAAPADDEHCMTGEGDFNASDTNTTSIVTQALMVVPGAQKWNKSPFRFFRAIRDRVAKGWGFTWDFQITDANSTSLVIQAYVAAGKSLPRRAKWALRRLQYGKCSKHGPAFAFTYVDENSDGEFSRRERTGADLGATIGAIPGMFEKPLPLRFRAVNRGVPNFACTK